MYILSFSLAEAARAANSERKSVIHKQPGDQIVNEGRKQCNWYADNVNII